MNLHVISPGPLTTVQDAGRTGYAARGFRTCGAADGYAMRTANLLAGNPQAAGAAVLEMTLQGGKYQFDGDAVFALAGADMPAALDGRPVPAYTPLLARAGQVLAIGAARSGLRGYLAVFGGVDTPPVLGSRSTDLKCRMGGLDGRALKAWGCAAHWGGTRHGGTALAADLRQRGKPPAGHGAHPRKAVALFGRAEAAAVPCGARPPDRCLYRSGAGRICTRGICFDSRL